MILPRRPPACGQQFENVLHGYRSSDDLVAVAGSILDISFQHNQLHPSPARYPARCSSLHWENDQPSRFLFREGEEGFMPDSHVLLPGSRTQARKVKAELHSLSRKSYTETPQAMSLVDGTADNSAADLINLNKILEACIFVPDIGDTTREPGLTREQRFCFALERFETTTRVFDQSYYESEVLHVGITEEELDERLRREAKEHDVLESHFPSTAARRRRNHRLSKQQSVARTYNPPESILEQKTLTMFQDSLRSPSSQRFAALSPLPTISVSSRPAMTLNSSEVKPARDHGLRSPTPAASVVSFKTTSSQSSWFSNRLLGKRRDSLMHFFRRDSSSRNNSIAGDHYAVSPASPIESPASFVHHIIAEEPDDASPTSHASQDLSSIQSLPISSRTSTSSFSEQRQPFQMIFEVDQPKIEQFTQSKPFVQLKNSCEDEMHRFNIFAADQHVSLSLILGRNLVYNKERRQTKLADLQKQHETAVEEMDDRHAEKELVVRESLRATMEDNVAWNATAVKHVARRIALLGAEATPEHLHRLEEEQSALNRLAIGHEVEVRNLLRYQESRKLELLRKQEKEYGDLSKSSEKELETLRREKTLQLQSNISKLDDLLEERRARLVARWFLRLQVLKTMSNDTAAIESALPLSLLGLPVAFTVGLGYS